MWGFSKQIEVIILRMQSLKLSAPGTLAFTPAKVTSASWNRSKGRRNSLRSEVYRRPSRTCPSWVRGELMIVCPYMGRLDLFELQRVACHEDLHAHDKIQKKKKKHMSEK
jgi:hypothetical protein